VSVYQTTTASRAFRSRSFSQLRRPPAIHYSNERRNKRDKNSCGFQPARAKNPLNQCAISRENPGVPCNQAKVAEGEKKRGVRSSVPLCRFFFLLLPLSLSYTTCAQQAQNREMQKGDVTTACIQSNFPGKPHVEASRPACGMAGIGVRGTRTSFFKYQISLSLSSFLSLSLSLSL